VGTAEGWENQQVHFTSLSRVVQTSLLRFEIEQMVTLERPPCQSLFAFWLVDASFLAAAFTLATCTISISPPNSRWHTLPGLTPQKGHVKLIGLTDTNRNTTVDFLFVIRAQLMPHPFSASPFKALPQTVWLASGLDWL
jgi:hypothetical protein